MTSILIPIERFSFFVPACIKNICRTAGMPAKEIDIVFLISQHVSPYVLDAIRASSCRSLFIEVPQHIDKAYGLEHQIMLDKAIRDDSLSDWVVIQHCDLIWKKNGWLKKLLKCSQKTKKTTIPHKQNTKHIINGKPVPLVGDFFGFFNRTKLDDKSTFRCGYYNKEWVDGSVLLSLRLAELDEIENPIDLSSYFYHLMAFFRIWESFTFENGILRSSLPLEDAFGLPRELWVKAFAAYAYLTSFAIKPDEIQDKVLPWNLFSRVIDFNINEIKDICNFFIERKLPLNSNYVDEIIFNNGASINRRIKL